MVAERRQVRPAWQDMQDRPRQAAGEGRHRCRRGYLIEFGHDEGRRDADGAGAIGPVPWRILLPLCSGATGDWGIS